MVALFYCRRIAHLREAIYALFNIYMLVKYIFFTLWVCMVTSVESQVSHLSISGKMNYSRKSIVAVIREYDSFSYQTINDSMAIRKELHTISKVQKIYTPTIGYDVSGNIHFRVLNRLSVRTGLGLNYLSFKSESKFLDSQSVTLSTDTINTEINDITIILSACDSFRNSLSDIGKVKSGLTREIYSLKIPLVLEYEMLKDKIFLKFGAYMQTPLFSVAKREYITTRSELVNGTKICEWVKVAEKNTSGSNLNNFQVGGNVELAYRIFQNFSIELGVTKDFGNVFTKEEFQVYPASSEEYRPLKFSLGVGYVFGYREGGNKTNLTE